MAGPLRWAPDPEVATEPADGVLFRTIDVVAERARQLIPLLRQATTPADAGRGGAPRYLAERRAEAAALGARPLERIVERAGIEDPKRATSQVARHMLITEGRRLGMSDEQLQALVGHRHKETTARYGNEFFDLSSTPRLAIASSSGEAAAKQQGDAR